MKTLRSCLCRSLLVAVFLCAASFALPLRADVPPPEAQLCEGKSVGAVCKGGSCQNGKCDKLDYAHWDRDASPDRPPTTSYDCVVCVPKNATQDGGLNPKGKDDSGCSLGVANATGALPFAWLIGAVALVRSRRRLR